MVAFGDRHNSATVRGRGDTARGDTAVMRETMRVCVPLLQQAAGMPAQVAAQDTALCWIRGCVVHLQGMQLWGRANAG